MIARNTDTAFGWVTRLLHWTMAAALIFMIWLGTDIADPYTSHDKTLFMGLHRTIGMVLLIAIITRMLWHLYSPPPAPMRALPKSRLTQHVLIRWIPSERIVRMGFYAVMVALPLSGWFASSASGLETPVYKTIPLPNIAPTSELLEKTGIAIHDISGKLLVLFLAIHATRALSHQFWMRDGTLARMVHKS